MANLLAYISMATIGLPILVGVIKWGKLSANQKVFTIYLALVGLIQAIGEWMSSHDQSNLLLYHVYILLEFLILLKLFTPYLKQISTYFAGVALALFAAAFVWQLSTAPLEMPLYSRSTEGVLVIAFSLAFYFQSFKQLAVARIERSFLFWVGSSMLIYFTGNLLLFTFSHFVDQASDHVYYSVWSLHSLFNILLYLSLTVAMLCQDLTLSSSPSLPPVPSSHSSL